MTAGGARVVDGYVDEVRTRRGKTVVWVKDDEGNVYRRDPGDVEPAVAP